MRESLYPPLVYPAFLTAISGINFTRREVDIMACLLSARGTSKIASFLSVAPKTVVNHIRNIMIKLECNSREGIIDFIERSHKLPLLRKHYSNLIIHAAFEKSLKDISKLNREERFSCKIAYERKDEHQKHLAYCLITHLKLVSLLPHEEHLSFSDLLSHPHKKENIIYILSEEDIKTFLTLEKVTSLELTSKKLNQILLILPERDISNLLPKEPSNFKYVDFEKEKNYYLSFFDVLGNLLSQTNFQKSFIEFKDFYESTEKNPEVPLTILNQK